MRFLIGLATVVLLIPFGFSTPEVQEEVTLTISGMGWGSCVSTVRSALQSVTGVKEAKVSLSDEEAVVKYDPDKVKVEDLIAAVKNAQGMSRYSAKVKAAD